MPLQEIQSIADPAVRRAFDGANQFVERGFYQPYRDAGIVATGAGCVLARPTVAATLRDISGWTMPGANTSNICGSFGLPPLWISGSLGLRIYYIGAAASTANISFAYDLDPVAIGEVPVNATVVAAFNTPGPAVAGALLFVDVPTLVAVDAASVLVGWKVQRNNPDSYGANDIWIVAVRPLWYPERQ